MRDSILALFSLNAKDNYTHPGGSQQENDFISQENNISDYIK